MAVAVRSVRAGSALLGALLGTCAYAAFAGGASRVGDEVWLQLALAVLALAAATGWLAGAPGVRVTAPRAAWVGIGLLAAFAAWSGITLAWSVAPDRTWASTNRAAAYALVAGLAVVAGASAPRAIERLALGWLAVACAVALWALAGKALPGIVDGTALTGRLREPLGYWNALAAVCAFGVPVAVRLVTDGERALRARLAGLAACWLLLAVAAMTYSRGGLLALGAAVGVAVLLGRERLGALAALAAAAAGTLPALGVAFGDPVLRGADVPLDDRVPAGLRLLAVGLAGLAVLLAAAALVLRRAPGARWPAARRRALVVRAGRLAVVLGVLWLVGVAASERGIDGALADTAAAFTDGAGDGGGAAGDPERLASATSSNRWAWWGEALGAWADRPAGGWGAGSFAVTHLLYRRTTTAVAQPHDVPLQWLAETGVVGLLLAVAGLALLGAAAFVRVRGMPHGRERDLAAALLGVAAAWAAHALVEWHWDIPGVTVPALLAVGVLAARPGGGGDARAPGGLRLGALAAVTAAFAALAVSAAVPAWSTARAADAQTAASRAGGDPRALADAAATAELAARVDPLSVRPLLAAAAIAEGRRRPLAARAALLRAVRRQPWNATAWARLSEVALSLADRRGAAQAAQRWLELDPASPAAREAAYATRALLTAPSQSPTATGTPLPGGPLRPAGQRRPGRGRRLRRRRQPVSYTHLTLPTN